VETILIAGVDGVAGANFAACLSSRQPVVGVALQDNVHLQGCDTELCRSTALETIQKLVDRIGPQRIVYCGAGAQSCWDTGGELAANEAERSAAWHQAAERCGAHWTLISSDGVFTGPWMFHAENSQSLCASSEATVLRSVEEQTAACRPDALIVRTHAFGWAPTGDSSRHGWIERLLDGLDQGESCSLDGVRHASPILATDLVDVVVRAWNSGLAGLYHIAGAERVNPVQFARQLAHEFGLPFLRSGSSESLTDRVVGFGRGETSLQTRKVRRALGIGLPMLSEGLHRLYQQHQEGYRARLHGNESLTLTRVA